MLGTLRNFLRALRGSWVALGLLLEVLGAFLAPFGFVLGGLGASWLGSSRPWVPWVALGRILGLSCVALGWSWVILEGSWGGLGT